MSSGCVGILAKFHSAPSAPSIERKRRRSPKRNRGQRLSRKRQWSSSSEVMESNVRNSQFHGTQLSANPSIANEELKLTEKNVNVSSFVNQGLPIHLKAGAIAWHERRKEWVGDQSQKAHRMPREQVISWSTTYDDLLSTSRPFPQPIPLPEMVDFLVGIWQEEGLYD